VLAREDLYLLVYNWFCTTSNALAFVPEILDTLTSETLTPTCSLEIGTGKIYTCWFCGKKTQDLAVRSRRGD